MKKLTIIITALFVLASCKTKEDMSYDHQVLTTINNLPRPVILITKNTNDYDLQSSIVVRDALGSLHCYSSDAALESMLVIDIANMHVGDTIR